MYNPYFLKAEDLLDWMEAIEVIADILHSYDVKIPTKVAAKEGFIESMCIAKSLLLFLGRIVRAAKDKRCFVHFDVSCFEFSTN